MLNTAQTTLSDGTGPDDTLDRSMLHTTEIDGASIRYFVRPGDADQPPLLLCNGLGQSIEILAPLIRELPGRTIIAFDIPGVGRSEMLPHVRSIQQYAAFIRQLLAHIGIGQFDVLGISWGGSVSQQLAHDEPDRVRKLVLAITSAGGIGSWWGTPIALSEILFPMRYMNKAYGNFIGPWMYGGEAILKPGIFREYSKHAIAPSAEGYFSQVNAMCSWTSLPWLRRLKQQTLVIAGQYDGLIPITNQLLLAHKIPNAQLHVYHAGHLLMYTQRKQVGALVSTFLS
ncbi:alpha/beta hydrolase [Actibacterium sp. XHP0104]|uniref:alpha/beta hydrolase n=1 Tax=Actibacterium sp. XHP0104 TaxID=2984335 RepID=UPI0021E7D5EE|nr:alpha/beta hydrolase [Actibacterium sp. XHP0104]MCV2882140.1 alpha/beta hydrolase [Actibacterium sp. XHP0104]